MAVFKKICIIQFHDTFEDVTIALLYLEKGIRVFCLFGY